MDARQVCEMLYEHRDVADVFPDEQKLVLADGVLNEIVPELRPRRTAMLMHDPASRGEQALPATFPGLIGKIGIFDIKRMIQRVEAAYCLILFAIDSTGTTTGPEHRNG